MTEGVFYIVKNIFVFKRQTVLGRACRGLTYGFFLLRNFSVTVSASPHVCLILILIFDVNVSKIMHF